LIEEAERFEALFDGRKDAYGVDRGGVVKAPLTTEMYARHLKGISGCGIGVFPVRDDATVKFGAIDLDEPDFELATYLADLLPGRCWIEESRSGNAHVWTFFDEALEAWAARSVLRSATMAAGRPEVEVFPKQAQLREGMVGNYINLPFFGRQRPMLTSPPERDAHVVLAWFLDCAEEQRASAEEWRRRARAIGAEPPGRRDPESEFGTRAGLHVCATHMLEHKEDNPLMTGHRHVVLFNLAKMILNCRDYDEADAMMLVEGYNDAGTAPLGAREIEQIVHNAARGGWTSTGCDDPIMAPYVSPDCSIAHGS
jgi:hypothetical protein